MARITINRDAFKIDERELAQGTLSIGRHPDNALHIDDPTVSSHHAKIVTLFNSSYIEDLGSTNGTFVNGRKVRTHTLHNGDLLGIGQYQLLFQADTSAAMQHANATMMMGVSQLEELTRKARQKKFAVPTASPANTAPRIDGEATLNLPPQAMSAAAKPVLKVHKNSGEPAITTNELPDIEDSTNLLDREQRPTPVANMRPLRKSDTSLLPSLKVIVLAVLATIATFTLLMLFFP